jgi:hypothetical protein
VLATIATNKEGRFKLSDVTKVALSSKATKEQVFAVLNLLGDGGSNLLRLRFGSMDKASNEVSLDEVVDKLRAWWREKTLTDSEWTKWSSRVEVAWELRKDNGA